MKDKHVNLSNGDDGEKIKMSPLQAIYLGYAVLYMHYGVSGETVAPYMTEKIFIIMSVIAAIYSIVILIYNHKFEQRNAAKVICYGALFAIVFGFLIFLVKLT